MTDPASAASSCLDAEDPEIVIPSLPSTGVTPTPSDATGSNPRVRNQGSCRLLPLLGGPRSRDHRHFRVLQQWCADSLQIIDKSRNRRPGN
ncbi:hypothetical protein CDAR_531931 [Caerostris darwini]|uniref:Uncharacterized protein n=1 Tax=Caerostris darwini TaxID=1538125 RepID=A0AAV4WBW0_9ARAC|nr:hypothetical protein CDAR_531931 [Caerostris darwini]